jgi:hypothetical protein
VNEAPLLSGEPDHVIRLRATRHSGYDHAHGLKSRRRAMMYDQYITVHGYGIGPLQLLIVAAVIIVPFWQIFSKAGYSGWLSFLVLLPFINLIALYVLAFSDWPALRKKAAPLT